ncbi:hypothetical protein R84B8_01824 [Treponema sp. R8-4-B8]
MKLIDIIIISLCVIGLIYFAFDRLKYSNLKAFHKKLERLNELKKTIAAVENDNKKTEDFIKSINADTVYDDETLERLINYRDNEEKLDDLKNEQRKIELYIKNARSYFKNYMF